MTKKKLGNNGFIYPMPMTLIGSEVNGKANFLAAAWITRVDFKPPRIGVALGKHVTNQGIELHKEFSVNIPSEDLVKKVDYCGIVSGAKVDKSQLFKTFNGELKHAPMIEECPLTMECKLIKIVPFDIDTLYIAEIVGVYSEDKFLKDGNPDIEKLKPFVLSMPDNGYWSIGQRIGTAWSDGKSL